MASARATLQTVISADATKFHASMRNVQSSAARAGKGIAKGVAVGAAGVAALGVAAAAGVAVMGKRMAEGVKAALDLGGALSDVSAQTGISAGQVAVLQRAFQDNGIAADKLGGVINKMQRSISDFGQGSSEATRAFEGLGISLGDIEGLSPEKQFELIAQRISAIQNPTERAAAAMRIFGRSGGELLTLFADSGAIAKAGTSLGTQAEILDRQSGKFDRASDLLGGASAKMQGFFVGIADVVIDPLLALLERFNELDLAAMGQAAGEAIMQAAQWAEGMIDDAVNFGNTLTHYIKIAGEAFMMAFSGDLWTSLAKYGIAAFMDIFNSAVKSGTAFVEMLKMSLPMAAELFLKIFSIVTKPEFWAGLKDVLAGLAIGFGARMLDVVSAFLAQVSKIPGIGKYLGKAAEKVSSGAAAMHSQSEEMMGRGKDVLGPMIDDVLSTAADMGKRAQDAFRDAYASTGDFFDAKGTREQAAEAMENATRFLRDAIENAPPKVSGVLRKALEDISAQFAATGAGTTSDAVMTEADKWRKKQAEAQAAGFRGLGDLYGMQAERASGIGPGETNVFARDRQRLGIASGIETGGVGAKRRVGRDKSEKKRETLEERQVSHLEAIENKISQAITVG